MNIVADLTGIVPGDGQPTDGASANVWILEHDTVRPSIGEVQGGAVVLLHEARVAEWGGVKAAELCHQGPLEHV